MYIAFPNCYISFSLYLYIFNNSILSLSDQVHSLQCRGFDMIVFGSNRIGLIQRHHFSTSVVISNVYSMKEDLETLGVTVNSTKKDIKAAYFKKAKALHPDNIQR